MPSTTRRCALLALVILATFSYSRSADEVNFLQKRVCRFTFHGRNSLASTHNPGEGPRGIVVAMRDLAAHAEVPICIEELPSPPGAVIVPIEINARNSTVKDILNKMIAQDSRYGYRERLGVIEVFPYGADSDPANCLNMIIPVFKARNEWNSLIQSLRCEVDIVSRSPNAIVPDPWVSGGCGGSFPGLPAAPPGIIETDFVGRTVRDILGLLCTKTGNMAWSASFSTPGEKCQGLSLSTYRPRQWYPSDTVPLTWHEGLPRTCLKCHYHKPCHSK